MSKASELQKYKELLDQGAITQEDYNQIKNNIIYDQMADKAELIKQKEIKKEENRKHRAIVFRNVGMILSIISMSKNILCSLLIITIDDSNALFISAFLGGFLIVVDATAFVFNGLAIGKLDDNKKISSLLFTIFTAVFIMLFIVSCIIG